MAGPKGVNVRGLGVLGGAIGKNVQEAVSQGQKILGGQGAKISAGTGDWQASSSAFKTLVSELKNSVKQLKEFNKEIEKVNKGMKGAPSGGGGGKGGGGGGIGGGGAFAQAASGAIMGMGYQAANVIMGTITNLLTAGIARRLSSDDLGARLGMIASGGRLWGQENRQIAVAARKGVGRGFGGERNPDLPAYTANNPLNPISEILQGSETFGTYSNEERMALLSSMSRSGFTNPRGQEGFKGGTLPFAIAATLGTSLETPARLMQTGAGAGLGQQGNLGLMGFAATAAKEFGGDRPTVLFEKMVDHLEKISEQGEKGLASQAGFMANLVGRGMSAEDAARVAGQTSGMFRGVNLLSTLAYSKVGGAPNMFSFLERAQLSELPNETLARTFPGRTEEIMKFRGGILGKGGETSSQTGSDLRMAGLQGFLNMVGAGKAPGGMAMAQTLLAGQGINLDLPSLQRIIKGDWTPEDTKQLDPQNQIRTLQDIETNTKKSADSLENFINLYADMIEKSGEAGKKTIQEWRERIPRAVGEVTVGAGGASLGGEFSGQTGEIGAPRSGTMAANLEKFTDSIKRAEDKHGLRRGELFALLHTESAFNPNAKNPSGASGIGQFTKSTFKSRHPELSPDVRITDPEFMINESAEYLSELKRKEGGSFAKAVYDYKGVAVGGATMGNVYEAASLADKYNSKFSGDDSTNFGMMMETFRQQNQLLQSMKNSLNGINITNQSMEIQGQRNQGPTTPTDIIIE